MTRLLATRTILGVVTAISLGWSSLSTGAWGACVDDRYTAVLRTPSRVVLQFRVSNGGTIIDDIVLSFKNYLPPCAGADPVSGPLSGLRGSISNCTINIQGRAPRIDSFSLIASWNDTTRTFEGSWAIVVDGCSDGGSASAGGSGGSGNNGGDDDDDDGGDDDDSAGFSDGSLRVNSGADSPEAEIIGIDFDITPNVFELPVVSTPDVPLATATVRLIYSNGRIVAGKVMEATRCKLVSNANNPTLKTWRNRKDFREWYLKRKLNPDTTAVAEVNSVPNVVVTGDYPVEVEYKADDTGDVVFRKEATIRIINPSKEPGQAFVTPPTPRKLFHRGVK